MATSERNPDLMILVVDDHPITRNMVKAILKGLGYKNIFQAECGATAIQLLKTEKFELIICDWNMPQMSGLDVLKKVRDMKKYKAIPFLMLTAEAYRENVTAAMQSGVTDYIIKPFTADVLANKIDTCLG